MDEQRATGSDVEGGRREERRKGKRERTATKGKAMRWEVEVEPIASWQMRPNNGQTTRIVDALFTHEALLSLHLFPVRG